MRTPTCSHTYEPNVGPQGGLDCEHWHTLGVSHFCGLAAVRGPGMENNRDPPSFQPFEEDRRQQERGLPSLLPWDWPLCHQHQNMTNLRPIRPHLLVLLITGSH